MFKYVQLTNDRKFKYTKSFYGNNDIVCDQKGINCLNPVCASC